MLMLYFSGTGNSKYIAELFSKNTNADCFSIEENIDFGAQIAAHDTIAFCYPIYGSRVPRIMREFVLRHMERLYGKKVIIFCTQWLFSGNGAQAFATLFAPGHIRVIYAEHFFMPNNVSNMAILPLASDRAMQRYARKARQKMRQVCKDIKAGILKKRGFNRGSRMLGLLQGAFFPMLEKKAKTSVKIKAHCTTCGRCVALCPMKNLAITNGKVRQKQDCTTCYRCVNECPHRAITVFWHGKVKRQYRWKRKRRSFHEITSYQRFGRNHQKQPLCTAPSAR